MFLLVLRCIVNYMVKALWIFKTKRSSIRDIDSSWRCSLQWVWCQSNYVAVLRVATCVLCHTLLSRLR